MRIRLAALAAAAGLAAAVVPAHAATAKPQITDATGDANGINQQFPGLGPTPPQTSTAPADLASADITSVLFQTVFVTKKVKGKTVKVPNGFTITLNLAAAPGPNVFYRVSGAAADCASVFFEYDNTAGLSGSDARCPALPTPGSTQVDYGVKGKIVGTKIVWTVPNGVFKNGTTFSSLNAQTRLSEAAVVVPQVDYAESSATYKVGK
jgi:hypothetical protein